jgi:hypothetical protein
MFVHREDTPLVFFISELNDEMRDRIVEWFVRRQPVHCVRRLLNKERDDHGHDFELIFADKKDAVEFKLTFL